MVAVPMWLANSRSASGGMAWSFGATSYQEGSGRHQLRDLLDHATDRHGTPPSHSQPQPHT